jgi:hypothetical protein
MNVDIKIVKDIQAFYLFSDSDFISRWEELAIQSERVTVFQEPPYVVPWYRLYSNKYQPVLILGYEENSSLIGIMPLAFSLKDHYLTHAVDVVAEYHGWICSKDSEQDFPVQALIAIKKNFKIRIWQWRYLPPRFERNSLSPVALKKEKIYISFAERDSPVLDLKDENKINKIKKNKSIQIKINRYKKKNGLYLERIISKEKAREVFDILSVQCDFRQLAIHRTTPFMNDENKKNFYIERMDFPENNHFTILWSGNIPVAFHLGVCDSDSVYLGLSSYNPVEEKNSPGGILMVKLIELLREEGYHYFDLTPGGDLYKEKYSNIHQKLYMPIISFTKRDKIISDLKILLLESAKKSMFLVGTRPEIVRRKLYNAIASLKNLFRATPLEIVREAISSIYERKVYVLYEYCPDNSSLRNFQIEERISVNNYPDLLLYNDSVPWINKTDLTRIALKRFASDEILYTSVINGVLAHYGWIVKVGKENNFSGFDIMLDSPEDSCILYDFFTEPIFNSQGLFIHTVEKMLYDCLNNDRKKVYLWASENNTQSKDVIEKIGFRAYRKFKCVKTLWMVNRKEL